MRCIYLAPLVLALHAGQISAETSDVVKVLQIIEEQPESIEDWIEDRIYLASQRIAITHRGAFLCHQKSAISLPAFALDQRGIFIRCKKEEVNQEAQGHYDRAFKAFVEALGHSAAAGLSVEAPPLALFEGYQAVEAWKESAREFNAGTECEQRGTYTPPEPKSARDD